MCPSSPLIEQGFPSSSQFQDQLNSEETKSSAIPLPESHIHRTESELQLFEDMVEAEYRDRCMFNRLVTGIKRQQQLHYNCQRHSLSDGDIDISMDRNAHVPRSSSLENQPTDFLVKSPIPQPGAEQTIENIISARCQAIAIAAATPPISGPMTCNDSNFMNLWDKRSMPKNEVQDSRLDLDNEWAIEGFDSPRSERYVVHHHLIEDEDNDHSHHVFDIEL